MKTTINNRKGVALLMIAVLMLIALPLTVVLLNMSSSQKDQSSHYNTILTMEQIALSGMNMGVTKLKSNQRPQRLKYYTKEISGQDRFDLSIKPMGNGFFCQNNYQLMSKSDKGKQTSIIVADADQFVLEKGQSSVFVITNDFWTINKSYEISNKAGVIALKNIREKDVLNSIEIKKYEMSSSDAKFRNAIESLRTSLPKELDGIWAKVIDNMMDDKIKEGNNEAELALDKTVVEQEKNASKADELLTSLFGDYDDDDDDDEDSSSKKKKNKKNKKKKKNQEDDEDD